MLDMCSCEAAQSCRKTWKAAVHVRCGAAWSGQSESASLENHFHCCRVVVLAASPFPWRWLCEAGKQRWRSAAAPGWPAQSGSSPGAAGRWGRGRCRYEGWLGSRPGIRHMKDSAASSDPGPAERCNDSTESETEGWKMMHWKMIWRRKPSRILWHIEVWSSCRWNFASESTHLLKCFLRCNNSYWPHYMHTHTKVSCSLKAAICVRKISFIWAWIP